MKIKLKIPGAPVPKARPKFYRRGEGVGTYKTDAQEAAEALFKFQAKKQLWAQRINEPIPAGQPLRLKCWFFMPIAKSAAKKFKRQCSSESVPHTKKPDIDNLVKFVMDCLNELAWSDDTQVVEIAATKMYSPTPSTCLVIETVNE